MHCNVLLNALMSHTHIKKYYSIVWYKYYSIHCSVFADFIWYKHYSEYYTIYCSIYYSILQYTTTFYSRYYT